MGRVEGKLPAGSWSRPHVNAPVSPLAILASQGRVGSQRALKAANALEGGAIGTYGCAAALNQIGCRALSRMGRLDDYRRYAKECLDMANAVQDAKSRASLLQMAQVWLRLAQAHDTKKHSDQGCE